MSSSAPAELRLLSFNIQAGTSTANYSEYFTRSWRQLLPNNQRMDNLDAIARLVADYDIVGLQEVDCGSLRSGFLNQAKYLSRHADFPWWTDQGNRKVGVIAHAGNGVLSRYVPDQIEDHRLPGAIPGRGALLLQFGSGEHALWIVILHLALGRRARIQQLRYVAQRIVQQPNLIVMGDLNTGPDSHEVHEFCERAGLIIPNDGLLTYPSWQPKRAIDHILVSPDVDITDLRVLSSTVSDHRPLAMSIRLPTDVSLQGHAHRDHEQQYPEQPRQTG
ncbi:MAG: endonuclease/exonuclease/phosphatase family protein [Pseudomonadota bacterium]